MIGDTPLFKGMGTHLSKELGSGGQRNVPDWNGSGVGGMSPT